MREITTKLYQYDELTDAAKQKAVEWFLTDYPDYNWWECALDYADELATNLGLHIKPHTRQSMRGDTITSPGFCFDLTYHTLEYRGTYYYNKSWMDKCKKEYGKDIFKRDTDLSKFLCQWKEKVLTLQKSAFYGLVLDVDCNRSIVIDVHNVYDKEITEIQQRQAEELIDLYNDFVLDLLQQEYNYLTSEEHAEEMICANEYEFTEDGQRA